MYNNLKGCNACSEILLLFVPQIFQKTLFILLMILFNENLFANNNETNEYRNISSSNYSLKSSTADIDILNYDLDLLIPMDSNILSGTEYITIKSLVADLDTVILEIDNGFLIEEVSLNSGILNTKYEPSAYRLTIALNDLFAINDTFAIKIKYKLLENNYGFYNYEMSSFTDFAVSWFPCIAFPNVDKAIFSLNITVPNGVTVASVGLLKNQITSSDNQWITYKWESVYPMAAHLVGIMMSRFYQKWSDLFINDNSISLKIDYYIFARDYEKAKIDFTNILASMDFFSNNIGIYPFEKYGMAEVEPLGYGGMEYQTMSMITSNWIRGDMSAEDGLVHELAHQWWGDAISFKNWSSIWLSEGFAEYFAALFHEHNYGTDAFKLLMNRKKERYISQAQSIDYPIFDPPFDGAYVNIVYKKGAWILHMLKSLLGNDKFWLLIRLYYDNFLHSVARISDFQHLSEAVYEDTLSWFFDSWIYGVGFPKLSVIFDQLEQIGDEYKYTIIVNQDQLLNGGTAFKFPLDFRFYENEAIMDTIIWINSDSQIVELFLPFLADSLYLDPEEKILLEYTIEPLPSISNDIITKINLNNPYPNPFNASLKIDFEISKSTNIELIVYDINGEEIIKIFDDIIERGSYNYIWKGQNNSKEEVSSGIYLITLKADNHIYSKKVALIR